MGAGGAARCVQTPGGKRRLDDRRSEDPLAGPREPGNRDPAEAGEGPRPGCVVVWGTGGDVCPCSHGRGREAAGRVQAGERWSRRPCRGRSGGGRTELQGGASSRRGDGEELVRKVGGPESVVPETEELGWGGSMSGMLPPLPMETTLPSSRGGAGQAGGPREWGDSQVQPRAPQPALPKTAEVTVSAIMGPGGCPGAPPSCP